MKPMSKQHPHAGFANVESTGKVKKCNWKDRLILRRYRFPASGESEQDLATRIDHAGVGYFFPLGTPDLEDGRRQSSPDLSDGSEARLEQCLPTFSPRIDRELRVVYEPRVVDLYHHSYVGGKAGRLASDSLPTNPNRQRVLVVELDAGIRRALCWSIDQQAGFGSVPCDSVESFIQALAVHKPRMVLLNHNLAGRIGFKSTGTIAPIQPGVPALTYSVHVDGDQMFVSTPGGAGGYLVKRVKPDRLLEPILKCHQPVRN